MRVKLSLPQPELKVIGLMLLMLQLELRRNVANKLWVFIIQLKRHIQVCMKITEVNRTRIKMELYASIGIVLQILYMTNLDQATKIIINMVRMIIIAEQLQQGATMYKNKLPLGGEVIYTVGKKEWKIQLYVIGLKKTYMSLMLANQVQTLLRQHQK